MNPDEVLPASMEPARQVEADADLPAVFKQRAAAAGARVVETTGTTLAGELGRLLAEADVRRVFVPAGEGLLSGDFRTRVLAALSTAGVAVLEHAETDRLFDLPAAITDVQAAIAETGTIVCTCGEGRPRGASLMPPLHLVVVGASQLVADLCDLLLLLESQAELPANVNLITGPSKTADIEGVLVTGVHGPGAVWILLVADM